MSATQNLQFSPAWWLPGAHAQTVWPTLNRAPVTMEEEWERFPLPDGDFLDLVWDAETADQINRPIVIIMHGLGGNINSTYSRGLMRACSKVGLRPLFKHSRGCSGEPNPLPRTYHSGQVYDVACLVAEMKRRYPNVPLYAVGISLSGNVLLKWLGETGNNQLDAAVAVSPPFELSKVANCLMQGMARFYQKWLLMTMKRTIREKFETGNAPFDLGKIEAIKTFRQFDELVTVPIHGFASVDDYYATASCRRYLSGITTPTLIIHSRDDPLMTPSVIPSERELSNTTELFLTDSGGHVGFISGTIPTCEEYWLESVIPHFFLNLKTEPKAMKHTVVANA